MVRAKRWSSLSVSSSSARSWFPDPRSSVTVGGEQYAGDGPGVREIVECMRITQVPATPSAIRGIVNLRGSVVPVIDPGVRFGIDARPITKWSCIVFVDIDVAGASAVMGLL